MPLFVKRPGQTRADTSRAYVSGLDILPTIAGLLGRRLGWKADGTSVFSRDGPGAPRGAHAAPRPVRRPSSSRRAGWSSAAPWTAWRRRDLFGNGRWSRVYRIGPHRRLLGGAVRRAAAPAVGAPAGPLRRAAATCAASTRAATRCPRWPPDAWSGGSAAGGRDLALAVNGRIAAVGRSFHLAGDRTPSGSRSTSRRRRCARGATR